MCHCSYTYGDCSSYTWQWLCTNALHHSSTQNAIPTVHCCSAKEAHSILVLLHLDLRFALHTGGSGPAHMCCSTVQGKMQSPTVQCCFEKQPHSRQCVTAVTPMEIALHTHGSGSAQMHCTTVQRKMQFPLFTAALQKRLTAYLCCCI